MNKNGVKLCKKGEALKGEKAKKLHFYENKKKLISIFYIKLAKKKMDF